MPQIAIAPIVIKDAIITIGLDDYEKNVSSATFKPSVNTTKVTWQGMTPAATFSDAGVPEVTWDLELEYAQDWETANSLSSYLLTNSGLSKTVIVQPQRGSGKKRFTATVTIVPGPIGGKVNDVAVGSVTLAVTGAPAPSVAP
jgi:hypothetical protein